MHIAVSWDISAAGERWNKINDEMRECLKSYSWVKPLSTFYVIQVSSETDRSNIQSSLQKIAQKVSENISFVITPLMQSGTYTGWLPRQTWNEINARTN